MRPERRSRKLRWTRSIIISSIVMCNAEGAIAKSVAVDATISRARQSVGDLVNARDANEIAFGMNATSFIRLVSLAIGQTLGERNEIVVTDMDHEANVATWLALERNGAQFRWWKMRDDGNLHVDDLTPLLSNRTRLVACTVASNAIGSIVDVAAAGNAAHSVGAEIFLDSVHYGPHGSIDVQAFDCDYLVCSGYKIFAPHMGFLWGRQELLEKLPDLSRGFYPRRAAGKNRGWDFYLRERGGNGCGGRYLESLGEKSRTRMTTNPARRTFADCARVDPGLRGNTFARNAPGAGTIVGRSIYGVADKRTRSISECQRYVSILPNVSPAKVTEELAKRNIGVRDGHMYTPRLMKRLGLAKESGAVRASLVHYNTIEEVRRFGAALGEIMSD